MRRAVRHFGLVCPFGWYFRPSKKRYTVLGDFCFLEFMAHRKQVSSVLADPDKLKAAQQAVEAMRRQMLSPRSLAVIKLARRMTAAEAPETEVPEASIAEAPAAPMAEVAQATEVPIYAWHSGDRNPAIGLGFQDWGERLQQEVLLEQEDG